MTGLTVLPHSSVNCSKTKFTNRLKTGTIVDRLLTKQVIIRKGESCISGELNAKLFKAVVVVSLHCRYIRVD